MIRPAEYSDPSGSGYFLAQATRPQTIGYALLDSPVALAAWMLDHDTDSYYKISRAFTDDRPAGNLTRDHILANLMLYWLTGTGASAARSYWEGGRTSSFMAGQDQVRRRFPSRSALQLSRTRSSRPRVAGSRSSTPTSSTFMRPRGVATLRPGRSRNCFRKRSVPPSGPSALRPHPAEACPPPLSRSFSAGHHAAPVRDHGLTPSGVMDFSST